MGIWGVIILRLKDPVHFLEKESHMNSDIYIKQVFKRLKLRFYNQYMEGKGSMIWIDNDAHYHIFKMTTVYYHHVGLIHID